MRNACMLPVHGSCNHHKSNLLKVTDEINYLLTCYYIFAFRLNTSTAKHHIFSLPTIQLSYQSFGIRLIDKSRSGTPLYQNLIKRINHICFLFQAWIPIRESAAFRFSWTRRKNFCESPIAGHDISVSQQKKSLEQKF